jgi:1-deoxy-D-xylulose-5-phosphate synthase
VILPSIESPADLKGLSYDELYELSGEIRNFIIETVTTTGGHLGSNLGVVELTIALHRVFDSPNDILLWDTGHQAYVHKLLTGRRYGFKHLRQRGGLSGYPNRSESPHDWIESSHASTALSYAHGLSVAMEQRKELVGHGGTRNVVAVVGDGSLTGGMAYEALNNLGHSNQRVVVILNDNRRSYAPTISKLSESLTNLRLNQTYLTMRDRLRRLVPHLPWFGKAAYRGIDGFTSVVREIVTPHTFFENLGVRYVGPVDGHNLEALEATIRSAATWDGPILVHVMTQKGRGYEPAVTDDLRMHDFKLPPRLNDEEVPPQSFTEAFSNALVALAGVDDRIVAITAAMAGPTGLIRFQERFPQRFFDVGIAEQHAVTAAAGMAMGGLKPVVAVYSTFFSRAFDQAHLDVGLHREPVVFVLDRAGITGDDGPSHHGVLDLVLGLSIPGLTIFAPSSAPEVEAMLGEALALDGPSMIRFPKTPAPVVAGGATGDGLHARKLRTGDGSVCILAVGKLVAAAVEAAAKLETEGIDATVWDVRVVSPPDPAMLTDALAHRQVVTAEDGMRQGGAGMFLADAMRAQSQARTGSHHAVPAGDLPPVTVLGIDRVFIPQDKPDRILARFGLDGPGLAASVREVVGSPARPGTTAVADLRP